MAATGHPAPPGFTLKALKLLLLPAREGDDRRELERAGTVLAKLA